MYPFKIVGFCWDAPGELERDRQNAPFANAILASYECNKDSVHYNCCKLEKDNVLFTSQTKTDNAVYVGVREQYIVSLHNIVN